MDPSNPEAQSSVPAFGLERGLLPLAAVLVSDDGHHLMVEADPTAGRMLLTFHAEDAEDTFAEAPARFEASLPRTITMTACAEVTGTRPQSDTFTDFEVSVALSWSIDEYFGVSHPDVTGRALVFDQSGVRSFDAARSHPLNRHNALRTTQPLQRNTEAARRRWRNRYPDLIKKIPRTRRPESIAA